MSNKARLYTHTPTNDCRPEYVAVYHIRKLPGDKRAREVEIARFSPEFRKDAQILADVLNCNVVGQERRGAPITQQIGRALDDFGNGRGMSAYQINLFQRVNRLPAMEEAIKSALSHVGMEIRIASGAPQQSTEEMKRLHEQLTTALRGKE